jgi:hypothetical protein
MTITLEIIGKGVQHLTYVELIIVIIILLGLLSLLTSFVFWIYTLYYGLKFYSYAKKNTNVFKKRRFLLEYWNMVKIVNLSLWRRYSVMTNLKKTLNYYCNDQDTEDSQVLFYKRKICKGYNLFILGIFIFLICIFIVLFIMWIKEV